MSLLVSLAILALLSLPLVFSIRRSNELFVLQVRKGRTKFVRGRVPRRLLQDIGDVVRRPRVVSAEIRVVREGGAPRVRAKGQLTDAQVQRLRNVVGTYQIAQIQAGQRPAG